MALDCFTLIPRGKYIVFLDLACIIHFTYEIYLKFFTVLINQERIFSIEMNYRIGWQLENS